MLRLLKFLPVVIPIAQKALRNAKVRELLHLKPLNDGKGAAGTGRGGRR